MLGIRAYEKWGRYLRRGLDDAHSVANDVRRQPGKCTTGQRGHDADNAVPPTASVDTKQLTTLVARSQERHPVSLLEEMLQARTLVRGRSGSSGSAQSRLKGGNVVKIISPQIPIFEGY